MFGDLGRIIRVMGQLKTKLPQVREKLDSTLFVGESGGGAVVASVTGRLALADLKISRDLPAELNGPGGLDVEMLGDLVKAAVSVAQEKAVAAAREAMRELTAGVNLPGLEGLM